MTQTTIPEIPRALRQCNDFEQSFLVEVYRADYSKSLKTGDLIDHIRAKSDDLGVSDNPVVEEAVSSLREFRSYHRGLISGYSGERKAYYALKRLRIPHEILFNVVLEHEGEFVEIDAIVLTPQKVFIIEAKSFSTSVSIDPQGFFRREDGSQYGNYNVGVRMSAKEDVLRRFLEKSFASSLPPDAIVGLILDAHDEGRPMISSEFDYVKLCHLGDVSFYVDGFGSKPEVFDCTEIGRMAQALARETNEGVEASVDFERVSKSLAEFISLVEECSDESRCEEASVLTEEAKRRAVANPKEPYIGRLKLHHICTAAASSFALGLFGGFAISKQGRLFL